MMMNGARLALQSMTFVCLLAVFTLAQQEIPRNSAGYLVDGKVITISGTRLTVITNLDRTIIELSENYDSIVPVPSSDYVFLTKGDTNRLLSIKSKKEVSCSWIPEGKIVTCCERLNGTVYLGIWPRRPVVKRIRMLENGRRPEPSDDDTEILCIDDQELEESTSSERPPMLKSITIRKDASMIPAKISFHKEDIVVQLISAFTDFEKHVKGPSMFSNIMFLRINENKEVSLVESIRISEN